uniref:Uncharacterized protein n=1 Tax=Avena sativa TaxID=4498 RepID=A0ACD5W6V0_AVESA
MFRRAKTTTTTMSTPRSEGEIRVQKVEKIELVRNLVTKPSMFYGANPRAGAASSTMRRGAADHGAAGGGKVLRPGVVSIEDINKRSEAYIRERKKLFLGLN